MPREPHPARPTAFFRRGAAGASPLKTRYVRSSMFERLWQTVYDPEPAEEPDSCTRRGSPSQFMTEFRYGRVNLMCSSAYGRKPTRKPDKATSYERVTTREATQSCQPRRRKLQSPRSRPFPSENRSVLLPRQRSGMRLSGRAISYQSQRSPWSNPEHCSLSNPRAGTDQY
jgi:hypothetical protein